MKEKKFEFAYKVFDNISELNKEDAELLGKAREVTRQAYAPYSKFNVGAAALLQNGEIITGTNQENAAYPVSICAERVLLGTVGNLYPGEPVKALAISYDSINTKSDHPISPCGMCRQAIHEYELRTDSPIRLILSGQEGNVYIIDDASQLLPFAFTSNELK